MIRTPKGPALLTALTDALGDALGDGLIYGRWAPNTTAARAVMGALLAEPELTAKHLAALAGISVLGNEFTTALVTHPNIEAAIVVDTLWYRAGWIAATATGETGMLPLAVAWTRRFHSDLDYHRRLRRRRIRAQAQATATRWEHWAVGQQPRIEFLARNYLQFVTEADLLSAGDALFAPPAQG